MSRSRDISLLLATPFVLCTTASARNLRSLCVKLATMLGRTSMHSRVISLCGWFLESHVYSLGQ